MDHQVGHGTHGDEHLTNWWGHAIWSDHAYENGPFAFAIINFIILVWLVGKFARKPFASYLDTRHTTIRENLAEATRMRDEAKSKLSEIQRKLDGLDREIADIKEHVAKDAEAEKQRIIADAHKEAERIVEQADKTLEKDLRRARKLLEREAVDAAMAAAESLVRQKITDSDRNRINEEYFEQIASSGGSN
jgi:F-type H+-transporting ATPase subunit b